MHLRTLRLLPYVLLALPLSLAAQSPIPLTIEARGGIAVPVGDFASSSEGFNAGNGPAFAAGVLVEPLSFLGLFAGYQQVRFDCSRCAAAGLDGSVVLAGPEAGIHLGAPVRFAGGAPWFRASVLYHSLAFSGMGDRITSDAEVGFMTAAGFSFPVYQRVAIVPAIRFLAVPADFEFSLLPDRSLDVTAVSFDLGLTYSF